MPEPLAQCAQCWVFQYTTDQLLDKAFGGSVSIAAQTCSSLAGTEYAEVATVILSAAKAFGLSIAKAAQFLLGNVNCKNVGTKDILKMEENHCTLGKSKILFKSAGHKKAVAAAYEIFAGINQMIGTVQTAHIDSEEGLRAWLNETFSDSGEIVKDVLAASESLLPVAIRQFQSASTKGEIKTVVVPNSILGAEFTLFAKSPKAEAEILANDDKGTVLATVPLNTAVKISPSWGFTFTVKGSFDGVKF